LSPDSTRATVTMQVDTLYRARVGSQLVFGNFRTKQWMINRLTGLKSDSIFALKPLYEGQENIRASEKFSSVSITAPALMYHHPRLTLSTEVIERPPYYISATAGYDSEKRGYGSTTIGNRNLLGLLRHVSLHVTASDLASSTLQTPRDSISGEAELRLEDHLFLGTRTHFLLSVWANKDIRSNESGGVEVFGASATIARRLTRKATYSAMLTYESRNDLANDLGVRPLATLTNDISWDNRNNFLHPQNGGFAKLHFELSYGLKQSNDNFYKFDAQWRGYTTVADIFTFALRLQGGTLFSYATDDPIASDQLFFLGGTGTVRGYAEDQLYIQQQDGKPTGIGARHYGLTSLELRMSLPANFELGWFIDGGILWEKSIKAGTGPSLRYHTPIGPLSFYYGFQIPTAKAYELGRFHFSIGYTF